MKSSQFLAQAPNSTFCCLLSIVYNKLYIRFEYSCSGHWTCPKLILNVTSQTPTEFARGFVSTLSTLVSAFRIHSYTEVPTSSSEGSFKDVNIQGKYFQLFTVRSSLQRVNICSFPSRAIF